SLPDSSLDLFYLPVFEFDRNRTAKNGQLDPDHTLGLEHFLHFAFHAGERAVLDLDAIAPFELRFRMGHARDVLALPAEHPFHFAIGHRRWGLVQTSTDEVTHAGRFAKQVQYAFVVLHLDHQVSRIQLPFAHHALAAAHFRDTLDRDNDLAELAVEPFDLDASFDRFLDRLLTSALDLYDIPSLVV